METLVSKHHRVIGQSVCDVCFTSSYTPVEHEADCDFAHPHGVLPDLEHQQCQYCKLMREYERLRAEYDAFLADHGHDGCEMRYDSALAACDAYRNLLQKYIAHVVACEGTDFLQMDTFGFTDRELATLRKLAK